MNRTLVAVALTGLVGTVVPMALQAQASATPTFSKDVAPILYQNCTSCHRAGEIGPMALITYKDARPWAKSIATRVANGTMPPWHADPAHGQFLNDRSLKAADRDAILKWANGGAPEGNPADLPQVPKFAEGWRMGKPDAVFTMLEDYPVPAAGTVDYKFFEVRVRLHPLDKVPRGPLGRSRSDKVCGAPRTRRSRTRRRSRTIARRSAIRARGSLVMRPGSRSACISPALL